ncbi:hypothetical protein CQW23_14429 [Capsicum baccatum]|uniref:Uncharacterized protein n=1 Tax=Capsicum baccatum TaxID=33114 RepID=A0A2G2WJ59_CAPBA|nr:hypothetical protein CQW23_14429 [Capsicum baccatum]
MYVDSTKIPDPPMPSYTVFIYSHNLFEKSKFKDYDSILESKLAHCQARVNSLASILANGNAIGENGSLTRLHDTHENIRSHDEVPKTTNGSSTSGWIAEEVTTFVLDQNLETILFGCSKDQMRGTPHYSSDYAGVTSIGRRVLGDGYSLTSQFESDIMATCLP